MSSYFTHTLEKNRDEIIPHAPSTALSIVDLESYQTFVSEKADKLDMMVHMQNQLDALTAFTWDVPNQPLSLRLVVTGDHNAMERITFGNRPPSASGTVRTHGSLCLIGADRLLDCARNADHTVLKGGRMPKGARPHVLKVPSGVYYMLVYYRFPFPDGNHPGFTSRLGDHYDYTVYLHHYPHPAPRVAPVRLKRGLIPWAGGEASAQAWGGRQPGSGEHEPEGTIHDHSGRPLGSL
jgi:hypothetical protein